MVYNILGELTPALKDIAAMVVAAQVATAVLAVLIMTLTN